MKKTLDRLAAVRKELAAIQNAIPDSETMQTAYTRHIQAAIDPVDAIIGMICTEGIIRDEFIVLNSKGQPSTDDEKLAIGHASRNIRDGEVVGIQSNADGSPVSDAITFLDGIRIVNF